MKTYTYAMSRFIFLLLCLSLIAWPIQGTPGLALRFVDVTLERVEPGASFNLRTLKNLPLVVINQDDEKGTDVVVETVLPNPMEMKDGYEPIPNPNWLQIVPSRFYLGPKASASADMVVTVPKDPKYIGHHYECIIYARTEHPKKQLAGHGVIFETGLRTRFRMSIGTLGPASLRQEMIEKRLAAINTNFTVNPDNSYALDVDLGRPVNLKEEKKISLKVINQADDAVDLKFKPVPPDPLNVPELGYVDAPDYHWVEVLTPKLKVSGNSIKEVKLRVTVPNENKYRNKKYMFLIQTTLGDDSLPLAYTNKLYVTTQP